MRPLRYPHDPGHHLAIGMKASLLQIREKHRCLPSARSVSNVDPVAEQFISSVRRNERDAD